MTTTAPTAIYLLEPPRARVCAVSLGLTVYLAEPLAWARQHAGDALAAFLGVAAPRGLLRWYHTSLVEDWRPVDARALAQLPAELSNWSLARPRHQLRFRVADNAFAPTTGLAYREVDDARRDRAGVLELRLPPESDPNELLQLALEIANRWPFFSAVGGYQVSWNEAEKSTAFAWAYRWCRRYVGLDAQDADAMAWEATRALPGTNWLTMIGRPLAAARAIDVATLRARAWSHDVAVYDAPQGVVVRAGAAPTLGDLNRADLAPAYVEVARALAAYVVAQPPEFWGGFYDDKRTGPWLRRLVEPAGWG